MRQVKGVQARYVAGTRGRRQAKGVQDSYKGYETDMRGPRQVQEV